MRKLLLCLTLAGVSLSLGTAQAQILRPFCSSPSLALYGSLARQVSLLELRLPVIA
jgi:hypothetical protein